MIKTHAALALALLLTASAHADDAPRAVVLRVPDCMGASSAAVKELVALELTPRLQVVEASDAPVLTASVECHASALLVVHDPARAEPLRVELDLAAAAPLARTRLLALTLAELITTSQLEQPPPQPAAQPEPDETQPASDAPRLQLWAAPSFAIAGEPALPLLGADVGVAPVLGPVLLAFDFQARFGQNERASSDVALRSFAAGLAIMPIWIDDGVQLSAGPGVRAGSVVLTARSHRAQIEASSVSALWLGPMATAALHWPFAHAIALRAAVEAGYFARATVGHDEDGGERLALRGPWLSLSFGLSLGLL